QSASRQRRRQEASASLHQVRAKVVTLEERVDTVVVPAAQRAGHMTTEAPDASRVALDLLRPVDGIVNRVARFEVATDGTADVLRCLTRVFERTVNFRAQS